ncbi:MAG: hypothetical protein ACLFST_13150 [Spirochaetia bacterium]
MNKGEEYRNPGEYTYYSDLNPDTAESDPKPKKKGGLFRNRSLLILLLDVALLLLVFLLYQIFARGAQDTVSIGNFRYSLSAFSFEDTVYASLKILNTDQEPTPDAAAEIAFKYGGDETPVRTILLPSPEGEEEYARTVLEWNPDYVTIKALIRTGEERAEIKARIRQE